MPVKALHLLIVSIVLLLSSGCAALRTAPEALPQLDDPAGYVHNALIVPQGAALSGIARIAIKTANASSSYKTVYACTYPDVLRLEVLGLFNQPALYISAYSQTGITLCVPSQNAWYQGPATVESMRGISGISMDPFDIVKTLHGSPPGPDSAQAEITCTQDNSSYKCTLTNAAAMQTLWIDPHTHKITRSRLSENNLAVHDIRYQDFQQHKEQNIPEKIIVTFDRYATSLEIKLKDPQTNHLDPEQLLLQVPNGSTALPLNAFFKGQ